MFPHFEVYFVSNHLDHTVSLFLTTVCEILMVAFALDRYSV